MKKEQEWIELRQILIRKLNFLQLIFIGKNDQSIRKIAKQLTVNDFKDNFHKSVLSLISIITKDFKIDNKYNEKEIDSNYIDGECFFFDIVFCNLLQLKPSVILKFKKITFLQWNHYVVGLQKGYISILS